MDNSQNILQRFALKVSDWSEKWFPDSYIFALLGVVIVALAAMAIGAPIQSVALSFGNGFWSLIPFTMQMCMLIVVGYVVSVSKPVGMLIDKLAKIPTSGRNAIVMVAMVEVMYKLKIINCYGTYAIIFTGCTAQDIVTNIYYWPERFTFTIDIFQTKA